MSLILGIDPGTEQSAWCLVEFQNNRVNILKHGLEKNAVCLASFEILLNHYVLDVIAIEMMSSYGRAVGRSVFETCVWIGVFKQYFESNKQQVSFIYRKRDVCKNLCKNARAKDKDVRAFLLKLVGPTGTKKSPGPTYGISKDKWSALAIAIAQFTLFGITRMGFR